MMLSPSAPSSVVGPRTESELQNELEFHLQSLNHQVDHLTTCPPTASMAPGEHLYKVEKEMPSNTTSSSANTRTMALFVHLPAKFPLEPPTFTTFGGFELVKYKTKTNTTATSPNASVDQKAIEGSSSNSGADRTVHFERKWSPSTSTLGEEVAAALARLDVLWGPNTSPVMNYASLRELASSLAQSVARGQQQQTSTSTTSNSATSRFDQFQDVVDNPATATEILLAEHEGTKAIAAATTATLNQLTDALALLERKQGALQQSKLRLKNSLQGAGFSASKVEEEGEGEEEPVDEVDEWVRRYVLPSSSPQVGGGGGVVSPTTRTSPTSTSTPSSSVQQALHLGKPDGLVKALKESCRVAFVEAEDAKKALLSTATSAPLADTTSGSRREFDALLMAVFEKSKSAHLLDLRRKIVASTKI